MAGRKITKLDFKNAVVVSRNNSVTNTLNLALGVLSEQLEKMALKSRVETFTPEEARVIQAYIKSLVELAREEREREKTDKELEKLKDLSDTELLELAKKHLETTKTEFSSEPTDV